MVTKHLGAKLGAGSNPAIPTRSEHMPILVRLSADTMIQYYGSTARLPRLKSPAWGYRYGHAISGVLVFGRADAYQ